ncbi:MAG: alginate export family protein [Gallionella sp.]|nr:alginate export family protein [Gallionella sp.]
MLLKQFRMKKIILSLAAGAALGTVPALSSAATDVNFSGDIIIRPFYRDNVRDFDSSVQDQKKFTSERARLKANIKVDQDISGVVEIMHFRKWGGTDPNRVVDATGGAAAAAADDNWMDLNQAYIEVKKLFDTNVTMKVGRQEMAYGDQRLVGNTNFWSTYPFPRAYDALKFSAKYETIDVDAWYATVTERQMAGLQGSPAAVSSMNSDRAFTGIWATLKNIPNHTVDLYLLNMDDGAYTAAGALGTYDGTAVIPNFGHFPYFVNAAGATASQTKVHNFGGRLKGKSGNLDYTVELNKQTGKFGGDSANVDATGGAATVGYTMPEAMGLRLVGEYVFASGDDTPTAGNHKTFYQFTPAPHGKLGAQDLVAFQNIKALRLGGAFNAKKNLKISLDYWDFKLDKSQDYWYGSNGISTRGSTIGAGAEGLLADKNVGSEVDITADYNYSPALSFQAGYSLFNPGSGIKNAVVGAAAVQGLTGHAAGKGDSATFAWGMLVLKF